MKETTLREMMNKHPERVIEYAVKGIASKGTSWTSDVYKVIRIRWTRSQTCSSEA